MEAITINGQEITFTPAPEFTYLTSLVFNGKAVKLSPPNKYSNSFKAYLQGGGQFGDEEKALIDQMVVALNERYNAEQEARKVARAEAARNVLEAQNKKLEGMDDVQIHD
jgi:phosphomannomutase